MPLPPPALHQPVIHWLPNHSDAGLKLLPCPQEWDDAMSKRGEGV